MSIAMSTIYLIAGGTVLVSAAAWASGHRARFVRMMLRPWLRQRGPTGTLRDGVIELDTSEAVRAFFGIPDAHGAGPADPWPTDHAAELIERWRSERAS